MTSQAVADNRRPDAAEIRSRPCLKCSLCGASGECLYEGLTDRLFAAPGIWDMKRCSNPECGLIWLDPMPLEEDIGKAYETYFTHGVSAPTSVSARARVLRRALELCRSAYCSSRFNYGADAGKLLRWLLAMPIRLSRIECDGLDIPMRYLAVATKGRMLDVGCGEGSVLKLAQDLGWTAEGVDFDAQAVDTVQRKGLSVKLGCLADQHYRDESFDLVLMSHVIEHIHQPLATFVELHRVLRPGGALVVTTPNSDGWGNRHFGSDCFNLDPPRHLWIFNGRNLAMLAKRAGFVHATISSTLRITPIVFLQSRLIRDSGRGDLMRSPTLLEQLRPRAATFAEMLMRIWDPLAADELLLEGRK